MERRRFSQTMASELQTAFAVSHKMPWCDLLTAVKNCNKSLEKLQDFFFKTETKTKTKCSRTRPRLSFLSLRRRETKTLVSRTTSLPQSGWLPHLGSDSGSRRHHRTWQTRCRDVHVVDEATADVLLIFPKRVTLFWNMVYNKRSLDVFLLP